MQRFLAVWLPNWPLTRHRLDARRSPRPPQSPARAAAESARRSAGPFALVGEGPHGPVLQAVDEAAAAIGIAPGMALAAARALSPALRTAPADPVRDAAALAALARWCRRYAPPVAACPPDAIVIAITGAAHLFGGEAGLAEDLHRRLAARGIPARIAIADTARAALALARHAAGGAGPVICPPGRTAAALAPLPAAALDPPADDIRLLEELGLATIGDLMGVPRAALARRFAPAREKDRQDLLARLDAALGRRPDPLAPIAPPVDHRVLHSFPEPLRAIPDPAALLARPLGALLARLEEAGLGVRRIRAELFFVDGRVAGWEAATAAPSRNADHLLRLLALKAPAADPGFGLEALALTAAETAPLAARDADFAGRLAARESLATLLDRLAARLGADHVGMLAPAASHIPERAERRLVHPATPADWRSAAAPPGPPRPLQLFARPEEIAVTALLPEGPPLQFRWRRRLHRVARAQGPERIAPEWWRPQDADAPLRDYYRVEDEAGGRFWIFRAAPADGEAAAPRWFLHGLFP